MKFKFATAPIATIGICVAMCGAVGAGFYLSQRAVAQDAVWIINVDSSQKFQRMDGFGASFTDSSAELFMRRMTPSQRRDNLKRLFDPQSGMGLSFLRQPMGSSDFRLSDYTYDDVPPGEEDFEMKHFSIDKDRATILPVLKESLTINPTIFIMASPWSLPAWMKNPIKTDNPKLKKRGRHLFGGILRDEDAVYKAAGLYFARFAKAYAAEGVPIGAVTLQNEPWNENASYPTMGLPDWQEAKLAIEVGKAFERDGIKTRIIAWDHNWDAPGYAINVLKNDEARKYVDGSAFHCYGGDVSAQSKVHDVFPDKNIYFTECSSGAWAPDFDDNLIWSTKNLVIGATRNWAKTVAKWNMALDEGFGPKLDGGCANCRGVVTVSAQSGDIEGNSEFYALGHAAKWLRVGARRIASDDQNTVAFQNPDGSNVLIALNENVAPKPLALQWSGQTARVTLPARSVATLVWNKPTEKVQWWVTTGDRAQLMKAQAGAEWG